MRFSASLETRTRQRWDISALPGIGIRSCTTPRTRIPNSSIKRRIWSANFRPESQNASRLQRENAGLFRLYPCPVTALGELISAPNSAARNRRFCHKGRRNSQEGRRKSCFALFPTGKPSACRNATNVVDEIRKEDSV